MAYINRRSLQINPDTTTRVVRCVMEGDIIFTDYELNEIGEGLEFTLVCELWGADQILIEQPDLYPDPILRRSPSHDDFLLRVGSMRINRSMVSGNPVPFRFERSVSFDVLNEDRGTREGSYTISETDEIYAKLTLTNTYTRIQTQGSTNRYNYRF
ncbi:MAG: hypothetical protein HC836_30455 [Richelia sp. RM2_1_2]|nr:hypothetical protein [Richelia sp. RM2_1_2]